MHAKEKKLLGNTAATEMHTMKHYLFLIPFLIITGCANGYSQYYRSLTNAPTEVINERRAAPAPTTPEVMEVQTMPQSEEYAALGYVAIGYSSFHTGQKQPTTNAVIQGQKVGADLVVIVTPKFAGTRTGSIPITTPTTSTSFTTSNATAYGTGGTATASGQSRTTTYGTQTTYMPLSVNHYNYMAVYFVKLKHNLGAVWRDLTEEERAVLESNKGVVVQTVVKGSPAFRNDILVGDIVLSIDGSPVYGHAEASALIQEKAGREATLTIFRNGKLIDKLVTLNGD